MKKDYKKVIVSDRAPLDKSYVFFLFYLKFQPQEYQKIVNTEAKKSNNVVDFDKYEFRMFNWEKEKKVKDVLFVGSAADFPSNIVSHKIIQYPNGNPAILVVDPNNN
jgi:hypothetical protein